MRLPDLVKNWIKEYQHKTNNKHSKSAKTKTRRAHLRNLQRAVKSYLDRLEILRTENKRLRNALQQIADGDVAQSSIKGYIDEAYQQIARAALEDK